MRKSAEQPLSILGSLLVAASTALSVAQAAPADPLAIDWQGDARWSKFGFSDLQPFEALDLWTELKTAYFLDQERHTFGPYLSILGVYSSAEPTPGAFDWQRNIEARIGIQWFPGTDKGEWLQAVRLYSYYAVRQYASDLDLQDHDARIGLDFYHDNLPDAGNPVVVLAYANCAYRTTNFSDDFNAIMAEFNLKVGPRLGNLPVLVRSQLVPYALLEGAYAPQRDEWWINFIRAGGGFRFCFDPNRGGKDFWSDLVRRFTLYAEYVRQVSWLGEDAPSTVADYDYRCGISFSTSGFFNQR